jgi:hypothetical protein
VETLQIDAIEIFSIEVTDGVLRFPDISDLATRVASLISFQSGAKVVLIRNVGIAFAQNDVRSIARQRQKS